MAIILKGEKSLEKKIQKKEKSKERVSARLKTSKSELWSLRKRKLQDFFKQPFISKSRKTDVSANGASEDKTSSIKQQIRDLRQEIEKLDEEITALAKGHEGEEYITNLLKTSLSDDYYILNGKKVEANSNNPGKSSQKNRSKEKSQVEKAEIDHLVIGPTGILCIEVKNISGRFYYDSLEESWLKAPFANPRALKTPMTSPLKQINRASSIFSNYLSKLIAAEKDLDLDLELNKLKIHNLVVFTNDKCIFHGLENRWEVTIPLLLKDELIPYIESLPLDPELTDSDKTEKLAKIIVSKDAKKF